MHLDPQRLKPILEAALLASPRPMTPVQLAELFDLVERPSLDVIAQALAALVEDSSGRGVELIEVASGFRYQIRSEVFPHLGALWTERQSRYSRALLETLALIAYRQPITRGEIEQIRGVGVATSILRTIEEREWVRVVGHRDVPGRPALYGTTKAFLDYFKLRSLDELPPLSALSDLENMEPELMLAIDGPHAAANDPAPDADDDTALLAEAQRTDVAAIDTDSGVESGRLANAGDGHALDIDDGGNVDNDVDTNDQTIGTAEDDDIQVFDKAGSDVFDDSDSDSEPATRTTD